MSTTENRANQTSHREDDSFFNVLSSGMGYLNGVEMLSKSSKETVVTVKFTAVQGPSRNTTKVYYDLKVLKEELLEVITRYREAIEDSNTPVWVRIHWADPFPDTFIYSPKSSRAGQAGVTLNGRLTRIASMKVDNELVYEDKQGDEDTAQVEEVAGKGNPARNKRASNA